MSMIAEIANTVTSKMLVSVPKIETFNCTVQTIDQTSVSCILSGRPQKSVFSLTDPPKMFKPFTRHKPDTTSKMGRGQ